MFDRVKHIFIKEIIQMFRDKRMRAVIFVMPILQVMVFGYAVTTDVKNIPTAVYDLDKTPESRALIRDFNYSRYFDICKYISKDREQGSLIDRSIVKMILHINRGFGKTIKSGKVSDVQIIVDGTDSNTAAIIINYANQIINRYVIELSSKKNENVLKGRPSFAQIKLQNRAWFNENLESRNFYIPGVIALIVMLITLLLTSMAIVREKEIGTIEQLIVSPIRPFELILGKLLPFALVGILDAILVTIVGVLWFKVPIKGNVVFLLISTCCYLMTTLGVGLFISTISSTQQEAMMSTFFFYFPAVLLSGFMFPIANMPKIVQYVTYLNPLRYFLVILRGIFLKGIGFSILWPELLILFAMGFFVLVFSSLRFQKRLA